MELIPAIDIIDGKCVRLTQGDYDQKTVYDQSPLDRALQFEALGIRRLHLVDLDGAKKGSVVNQKVLELIARESNLIIDFGGGIKTEADIDSVFNAGASMATVGSIAVKQPELFSSWLMKYGADRMLLGADVKNEMLAVGGWLETTDKNIFDFLELNIRNGLKQAFCTDISKDGKLEGPSTDLYKRILEKFPTLQLIASGGVSKIRDLYDLKAAGCSGAIVGKAIYEERITVNELKEFIGHAH